ncbi:hypothetical protein AB3S75_013092 [Citrus x aurantiifolia]
MGCGNKDNLPKSYPMVGGDGTQSYAQNSSYQKGVMDAAKELIHEAITNKLDLNIMGLSHTTGTFHVADLGCSSGPNTFSAMQNIIEAVELKLIQLAEHQDPSALEFQVFFSDQYDNDFNTLFKTLPHSRRYFAAGVPGSFYGRLFPKSCLHFVHSCYALHWLSKVPEEIVDRNSPSWNSDSIHCTGSVKGVAEAYSARFMNDVEAFLNARTQEVVPGGLIVILILAVPDGIPFPKTAAGVLYDVFGSCLIDMAKMGLISEEKVYSFNLPIYHATPKELETLIQRNKYFSIERMEELNHPMRNTPFTAEDYTSNLRPVFEEIIKDHFGNEYVNQIFHNYTIKIAENLSIIEEKTNDIIDLFILLKRIISITD